MSGAAFVEKEAGVSRREEPEEMHDDYIAPATSVERKKTHRAEFGNNRTGRRFVFTKFIDEVSLCTTQIIKNDPEELQRISVRYAVWQVEKAPGTGKLHLQGYVELSKPSRFRNIHKLLGGGTSAWVNSARGTREQCRAYCTKSDSRLAHSLCGPYEVGTWESGGQGNRNDAQELKRIIDSDLSEIEIMEKHFDIWMRYWKTIEKAMKLKFNTLALKNFRTKLRILIGPPGTGK